MLVSQSYVDVAMPAPVKQLSERRTLLRKDRETSVPEVMKLKPGDARILAGALPGPAQAIRVQR